MTIHQWRREALSRLTGPDGAWEVGWMMADALGLSPSAARLIEDRPLSPAERQLLDGWLAKRLAGVPLQYAQNRAYFMGHEFFVDERVLIPRQDTELLCELAIERVRRGDLDVLDVCTGSGAIAISVALACPNARVWATDLSEAALSIARENAGRLGARVDFLAGDLFDPVAGRRFDIITCNPPYLTGDDMRTLQEEVAREPRMALYGGPDGLDFYRRAAREVRAHLHPGGWALFEVGAGQAKDVAALMGGACEIWTDLNQIERVVALAMGE